MDIKKEIGNKIKQARKSKGYSQKKLAELVGSNQEHISKVESGKINLTLDYINKIAGCLGIEINKLFKDNLK